MMDEAALAELAADIKAESQREPIYLWRDQIIDGRNRFAACKLAGVEPVFKKIDFPGGEAEALAYVVSRNLKRRHLTVAQRAVIAAKVATLKRGGDKSVNQHANWQSSKSSNGVSQEKAADMLNVSRASVQAAKAVLDRGGPELVAAVESGEIGLHKAAETVRSDAGPVPLTTKAVAEANTRKQIKSNARINNRDVRVVFRQLSDAERRRFLAEANTIDDILAWRMNTLDAQRRTVADAYFDALISNDERLPAAFF